MSSSTKSPPLSQGVNRGAKVTFHHCVISVTQYAGLLLSNASIIKIVDGNHLCLAWDINQANVEAYKNIPRRPWAPKGRARTHRRQPATDGDKRGELAHSAGRWYKRLAPVLIARLT
ncbi:MAG: hypothetical protein IH859_02120 [Chloroflexi bacterium]|nr:hypothetical protein [Chloroflexota bacterium]